MAAYAYQQQVYPQQVYGTPQQGYGAPQQGYGAPQQGYGAPQQGYAAPGYSAASANPSMQPQTGPGQPYVITTQPGAMPMQMAPGPLPNPPNDYLIVNILVLIFCCLFIGIGGVVCSVKSRDAARAGDEQEAIERSKKARSLAIAGVVVGIIFSVVIGVGYYYRYSYYRYQL